MSTKLTFSSFTTNLALALKVCFIKQNSSHEKSRVLRKDMLHESLQQGITKEIYTRKMRIFNFIYEFTYLKRELIK